MWSNADSLSQTNLWNSRTFWRWNDAAEKLPYDSDELAVPTELQDLKVRFRVYIAPRTRPERRDDAVSKLLAVVNLLAGRADPEYEPFRDEVEYVVEQAQSVDFPAQR